MEDAEILARPKRITGEFEITPDVKVRADESYLRRVLLNLLDNAIKYNVEDGSLSISLTKSDGLAVFRIANTGPGITKGHENRVFERFYRADPRRSSDIRAPQMPMLVSAAAVGGTFFVLGIPFAGLLATWFNGLRSFLSVQFKRANCKFGATDGEAAA